MSAIQSDFIGAHVEKLPWIKAVQATRSGAYVQPAERGFLTLALRAEDGTVVSARIERADANILAACLMIGGVGGELLPELGVAA